MRAWTLAGGTTRRQQERIQKWRQGFEKRGNIDEMIDELSLFSIRTGKEEGMTIMGSKRRERQQAESTQGELGLEGNGGVILCAIRVICQHLCDSKQEGTEGKASGRRESSR